MLKALFEVAVKSTGLGKTKGDLDAVGKSVNNVGQAHTAANKAAGGFYATQAKGVIGTSNSTKSFSKMASTMNGGGGLVGAYATLAANVFAVTAAFNALKGAAQVEQITRGLEVLGARSGQSLGIVAKGLKEVTNNAISTEQALRSTAQITSAGFKSDAVLKIGKLASDVSLALGRDMTDSMDRLTRGIIKLEPELLDELGLMTRLGEASAAYALQLGKPVTSLTTLEKRQGFMNAVMAEGELKFGGVSAAAGELKNYDKLAATFADLTKNILNTVNALGGLNIAGFFANNMTALAGAGVLFLSTLKSQLLPGLLSLTNKAAEAAAQAKANAVKEQQDILQYNKNPAYLNDIKNKGASAGVVDYTNALAANRQAITDTQAIVDKHSAAVTNNTKKLADARNALKDHGEVRIELTQALIANHDATTKQTAADAVASASTRQFGASIHYLNASVRSYSAGAYAASTATGFFSRALIFGKTAAYGFTLAARMVGAAVLSAIPIIGQIIFVVGLLVQAWNSWLKPEGMKKREEDLKKILAITDTTSEKEKALEKVRDSQASAAARVTQQIIIQSNALSELASAYADIAKEADRAAASEFKRSSTKPSMFNQIAANAASIGQASTDLFMDRTYARTTARKTEGSRIDRAREAGIGTTSPILDMIDVKTPFLDPSAIATLDSMHRLAPNVTKDVIKLYGGLEDLSAVELDEILPKIIEEIGRRSAGAAEMVQNLTTSLVELENAYVAYLTTAATKTPFDGLVTSSSKVISSMNALTGAVANGVVVAADWETALTSIGDKTRNTLSVESFDGLIALEKSIADLRKLELQPEGDRATNYEASLVAAKALVEENKEVLATVREEIKAQNTKLVLLQGQDTLLQGQINISKALLSAHSRDNALTAEGVAAQIDAENGIKALEIARLNVQKTMLDTEIERNEILIDHLEAKRLIQNMDNAAYRTLLETNIAENNRLKILYQTYNATHDGQDWNLTAIDEQIERGNTALAQLDSIESATGSIAAARQSQLALETQIAAIAISQVTQAEKDAQIQTARLKTATELYNLAEATRAVEFEHSVNLAKISNIQNGLNGTLMEQLTLQRASTAEELRKKRVQDAVVIANITAERAEANARRTAGAADVAADALFQTRINDTLVLQARENERLDSAAKLKELELASFNIRKEGLEWQKQSLEYIEKAVEEQNKLLRLEQDQSTLRTTLARRERGIADSESVTEANALASKELEYKLLVDGLELKLAMIDLEFSLLDAQRVLMIAELEQRKTVAGLTGQQNDQLNAIIDNLSSANTEGSRLLARRAAIVGVENAGLALNIASRREGGSNPGSRIADVATLQARRRSAANTAINYSNTGEPINTILPNTLDPSALAVPNLTESNVALTAALDKLRQVVSGVSDIAPQTAPNTSGPNLASADAAIRWVIARAAEAGVSAHESVQTGGVTARRRDASGKLVAGHAGNAHYEGRGVDLYSRPGTGESTDPAEKAKYDRLAAEFRALGATVLWQTEGHFNHMHVEFARGFTRYAEAAALMEQAGAATTNNIASGMIQAVSSGIPAGAAIVAETLARVPPAASATGASELSDVIVQGEKSAQASSVTTAQTQALNTPVADFVEQYTAGITEIISGFEQLGPDGEAMKNLVAGLSVIAVKAESAFAVFNGKDVSIADKFQAGAQVASAALSTIQGALAAASASKIAGIDAEIAAEQKRDGKSADSVAKIAALEKKKDATARKAFEVNKKLMIAQAVMSTAAAVVGALAAPPFPGSPFNIGMAVAMGALGAAQIAMIAGTSYSGGGAASTAISTPSALSIGKRGDSVDLAKNNANAGGEVGYLRGAQGRGSNASNYSVIGSAVGGSLPRGYGNTAFVVGEHGPETITPETPITVRPVNDNADSQRAMPPVNINIQALDAKGVEEILYGQRGNIIGMLREAANNSGQTFLENVNTAVYNKPNVGRL